MTFVDVELLDYQYMSLQDDSQFLLWHGGRGSAKTTTLVMDLYNTAVRFPGVPISLVANDHVQLRDSTHEALTRYLHAIGCPYRFLKQDRVLVFPNGSAVHELTFEKDKTSLKGAEWGATYVDEADGKNTTEDKFDYLVDSTRSAIGDRRIRVACNPVPPGHFLAERFFIKRRPRHVGYRVSTYMNAINLPLDYIQNMEAKYPPGTDEHRRWMLGELVSLRGAVYKMFGPNHIVRPQDLPISFDAYAYGQDLGVHDPHVLLEGGLDNQGVVWVTREYYVAGKDIVEHIPHLRGMYHDGWPIFSDHSATQHSIMAREGFNMRKANKDVDAGIHKVAARLNAGTLKISSACTNLIRDLYNYVWKDSPQLIKEQPDHRFSHGADALRYLIAGIDTESIFN